MSGRANKMEENKVKDKKCEDRFYDAIGQFGRWHILFMILIVVPTKLSACWTQLGIIFLAPKTTFYCVERSNNSQDIINSTCYSDCVKYEYVSEFDNTIISEWGLICERKWLANLTQMMCMFGYILGSVLFGFIGDRYGRRTALLSSCMLQLTVSLAAPFSPSFWLFTTFRFISGIASAGLTLAPFTIIFEYTGPRRREIVSSSITLPHTVGEMMMPVFAYYLRSWNTFSLGIMVPNVLFLVYFFTVPESPKWLISTGQLEKASEIMTRVAKSNNLPTNKMIDVVKTLAYEATSEKPKVRATYLDLFTKRSLRMKNILSCVAWFMIGLSYYGGNQYVGQTSSNVYVAVVLAGGLQIPGIFLALECSRHFGRRRTIISFSCICTVSNGMLACPDDWYYVKMVAGTLGISTCAGAFAILYMFTSEQFPTVIRTMAVGASSISSRGGSMVAPFVAGLGTVGFWVPPAIFATAPLVAGVACFCLPETKGVKMAEVMED